MSAANIALEVFCILISLLLILYLVTGENRREQLSRIFIAMLSANIAVLSCDLITWLWEGTFTFFSRPLLLAANFGVYSFGYLIVSLFTNYLVSYIATKTEISRKITQIITGLCGIAILLVVVSQFNQMYYYFNEDNFYVRGDFYWFSQLFPIGMLVADSVIVLRYRRALDRREILALLSYQVFPMIAMAIQIFIYGITLLYVSTSLSMLIIYLSVQAEMSRRLKVKEMELLDSRVRIMLSQIQPHFLYNALTAIHELCAIDPSQAQEAVLEFSHYLRGNMDSINCVYPIPFEKELEHVRTYLMLETRRFSTRLLITYEIITQDFCVPPLTLQPIVENAVRHGITKHRDGGTVCIRTTETARSYIITVSDNGVGFDPSAPLDPHRPHIGIENVRNRLASMCDGKLEIKSLPGAGCTVTIYIPKNLGRLE